MRTKKIEFRFFGEMNCFAMPRWSKTPTSLARRNYVNIILNVPFSKSNFKFPGMFSRIDSVIRKKSFSKFQGIRCLDMPIKMAGDDEYRIPLEFNQFIEPISKIINYEKVHNDRLKDFYAYLTVDQTETMMGDCHREPGLHVDGFQGARINPKVICDRSYIITDCDCPSFWNQGFGVTGLDESKDNFFLEFDKQKNLTNKMDALPYEIYFMDCYAVHSANRATQPKRTFLRLSFSVRQYDRLGNSHNNCFLYDWKMVKRDTPDNLI